MKAIHKYIMAVLLLCSACKESEIPFFDGTCNAVRFPEKTEDNNEPHGYNEETKLFNVSYSFVTTPNAKSFDYNLPVELIGLISDTDRDVAYTIDVGQSKAPIGSYEVLKSVIPAGKRSGAITIRLFNSVALKSDEYKLHITLIKSATLAPGPEAYIRAVLSWNERIPAPTHTDHFKTYNALIDGHTTFNSPDETYFSPNALRAIVEALKWYDWDDLKKHGNNRNGSRFYNYKYLPRFEVIHLGSQYKGYALVIADYIKRYNQAHPNAPLVHDAGVNKGKPIQARVYNN